MDCFSDLHFTYYNDKGEKDCIKYTTYLKFMIPDFKNLLGDLLIHILNDSHGISFKCISVHGKLRCIDEIMVIKFIRRYLRYLIGDDIKFSIKLLRPLLPDEDPYYYEIKLN